ncbi:MAG: molecular chaperone DnaJ [Acidimicrobiia bacterium]
MAPQREWFDTDYYAVLGVAPDASEKDITRAYRKLAKQYHPDANPGNKDAEERFKEVSAANDVLSDAEKRKEYDEVRRMVASGAYSGGGPGGPGGFGFGTGGPGGFQFDDTVDLGDLLGGLFGGRAGGGGARGFGGGGRRAARHAPQRGADLESEITLDFLDAVHGLTTSVAFTAEAACSECHGTGARPGTSPQVCTECGGTGEIAMNQGFFQTAQVCPVCHGRGSVIPDPCPRCHGGGTEVRRREVKVKIPAGVKDGQRIKVAKRGAAGRNGGPPGDLYVVVHVRPHRLFGRKGARDLTVHVPITFAEAALGAQVRVPTLGTPVTLKIKPGTQPGTTQKVKGRGIAGSNGHAGDLYVTFDVAVPAKLDHEQRAAVEALAAAFVDDPRAGLEV